MWMCKCTYCSFIQASAWTASVSPAQECNRFFPPFLPLLRSVFFFSTSLSHTRTHADDGVHTVLREPITTLCFQVLFVNGIFTGADESGAAPASVSTQPPHRGNIPIPFLSSPPFGVSLSLSVGCCLYLIFDATVLSCFFFFPSCPHFHFGFSFCLLEHSLSLFFFTTYSVLSFLSLFQCQSVIITIII